MKKNKVKFNQYKPTSYASEFIKLCVTHIRHHHGSKVPMATIS